MIVDIAQAPIAISTGYYEARAMRSCLTRELARVQRRASKGYAPEAGKIDKNAARIETINAAIADIDKALTAGIAAYKEAERGKAQA